MNILILDKNRIYQTRIGSSNQTKFDYLMERLSLDLEVDDKLSRVMIPDEHPLKKAIEEFKYKCGYELQLFKNDPMHPTKHALLAYEKGVDDDDIRKGVSTFIKLHRLGSGYEMLFSIILAVELAQHQSKDLSIIIDESELHLHPNLQETLIKMLLELSKKTQIIIATHSPLFIKQLSKDNIKYHVLYKREEAIGIQALQEKKLDYISMNEINFRAFGLYTEEYFNELYETLHLKNGKLSDGKLKSQLSFDKDFFVPKGLNSTKPSKCNLTTNDVTIITFIRNVIHHHPDYQEKNLNFSLQELKQAIDDMRSYL
ncbi:MAG: AAA family ATPase [Chitinophagaceae bacterium]